MRAQFRSPFISGRAQFVSPYVVDSTTRYVRIAIHGSALGATVEGVIWSNPGDVGIVGRELTQFAGFTSEAELDGDGKAVFLVPVSLVDETMTTADTPVALVRDGTHTTGIVACTVIEE